MNKPSNLNTNENNTHSTGKASSFLKKSILPMALASTLLAGSPKEARSQEKDSAKTSMENTRSIYSKNSKHVYCMGKIIKWADPETFQALKDGYAKDKNHAYYFSHILEWTDPETFQVLEYGYAKDKNHIYQYGENK